jgi:hypothetical protein
MTRLCMDDPWISIIQVSSPKKIMDYPWMDWIIQNNKKPLNALLYFF